MKTKIYINANVDEFKIENSIDCISEQRCAQILRIHDERERKLSVMAYELLQDVLYDEFHIYEPPVFDYLPGGKPVMRDLPDIHFNLSHCKGGAACIAGDKPVGIDIETKRPFKESLAHYIFADEDYDMIKNSKNPDEMFTKLWTVKEAVGKMLGTGLNGSMKKPVCMEDSEAGWKVWTLVLPKCFSGWLYLDELEQLAESKKSFNHKDKLFLSICQSVK